jgi:glutamate dehydrogenase
MGINFVERLQRETGAASAFIIRAFTIAESIFQLETMWQKITALDNKIDPLVQYRMMLQVYYLIRRATRWILRNRKSEISIQRTIDEFSENILDIINSLPLLLDKPDKLALDAATHYLIEQQVPEKLAKRVAAYNTLFTSLDIVEASHKYKLPLHDVAQTYYSLGNRLELNWLRELINSYVIDSQWDELARAGFRDDLDRVQRKLCAKVLMMKGKNVHDKNISERIEIWFKRHQFLLERWQKLITDVKSSEMTGFVAYSVVLRELFDFIQAN